MEMSIGCSLSIEFAGICTEMILCFFKKYINVGGSLSTKNIEQGQGRVGVLQLQCFPFLANERTMTVSIYHFIVSSLDHSCG